MTGTVDQLANTVCEAFQGELRRLIRDAIYFLCYYQFVTSSVLGSERAWRVVQGSGMGLSHSSSIADMAFFILAERRFGALRETHETLCIRHYVRYRDDIYFSGTCFTSLQLFIQELRKRAFPFIVEVEGCSRTRITMLCSDIEATEDKKYRLRLVQKIKGPPLSMSSAHSDTVHSWPYGLMKSIDSFITYEEDLVPERQKFIDRFVTNVAEPERIAKLRGMLLGPSRYKKKVKIRRDDPVPKDNMWLVLPYHPMWQYAPLNSLIRNFTSDPMKNMLFMDAFGTAIPPSIGVSWKNVLQPLFLLLRR